MAKMFLQNSQHLPPNSLGVDKTTETKNKRLCDFSDSVAHDGARTNTVIFQKLTQCKQKQQRMKTRKAENNDEL